jgi:hypothetical protein
MDCPRSTEAVAAVLEAAEKAVLSYGASAFQPPRDIFSLQRGLGVVSEKMPTLPLVAF